jgi:hypothetical protein
MYMCYQFYLRKIWKIPAMEIVRQTRKQFKAIMMLLFITEKKKSSTSVGVLCCCSQTLKFIFSSNMCWFLHCNWIRMGQFYRFTIHLHEKNTLFMLQRERFWFLCAICWWLCEYVLPYKFCIRSVWMEKEWFFHSSRFE